MQSTTFTFSFTLQLVNGVTNMATIIATAQAALQSLVAQGIVNCASTTRRHRRLKQRRRRLNLDPNLFGNVLFDVENCVEDAQNCPGDATCVTCTGTAEAFLRGDAPDEDVGTVISDYLQSPTFLTDSGLDQIASSFTATDAQHLDLPDVPGLNTTQSEAGSRGDPHFTAWKGEHFEFHGQCDLVLAKDDNFADGLGLDVQIRTKLVRYWSYIKTAAIRIGDDILEVEGSTDTEDDKPNYWINFVHRFKSDSIGGFPFAIFDNGVRPYPKLRFEIDLNSKFPGQKILLAVKKEFVKVDFVHASTEAFGKTVGILGDFQTGNTYGRDQATVIHDFNELGLEWQVRPADDMMLFHDVSHPQFPEPCLLPEDPRGQRRRRMGESTISEEEAERACATLKDPLSVKDCVYDILATQDLDMVGAY